MRVLVIEDDGDLAECMATLLEFSDVAVETARDGKAALEHLRAASALPDLILLDLMMPTMDGYQFRFEQCRDVALASIPTIVVTAVDAKREAERMGCALLRKPFTGDQLVSAIRSTGSEVRYEVRTAAERPSALREG